MQGQLTAGSFICIFLSVAGCGDPGVLVSQDVEIAVNDVATGEPARGIAVYRIYNADESTPLASHAEIAVQAEQGGQKPIQTDTNGIATVTFWTGALCFEGRASALGESCETIAMRDFVRDSMPTFLLYSKAESEILTLRMSPDTIRTGDSFSVTVLSITEPEAEFHTIPAVIRSVLGISRMEP